MKDLNIGERVAVITTREIGWIRVIDVQEKWAWVEMNNIRSEEKHYFSDLVAAPPVRKCDILAFLRRKRS